MEPVRAQSFLQYPPLASPKAGAPGPPPRSRARKVLGVLGSVVGCTVVFGVAAAAGILIHLDAPAVRSLVATQVTSVLHATLVGDIRIEHLGHLGLDGLRGVKVRIFDGEGIQVLAVEGVDVKVDGLGAARSALFGKGPITVDVPALRIGNVDANLDGDGKPGDQASLRIANAFAVRNPTPPDPNEQPGRGVKVTAHSIVLGHAWVHGTPPGAIPLDADARDLDANAYYDPNLTRAEVKKIALVTRGLPRGADPQGDIKATFAMPAANGQGMDVHAVFEGLLGGMPTSADARMEDKKILARVDTHDDTGAKVAALAPEVQLKDPFSLHAEAHGELPHVEAAAKIGLGRAKVDADAVVDLGDAAKNDPMHVVANLHARNVDAAAVVGSAPRTDVGLDAHGDVKLLGANIDGDAWLNTLPGTAAGQRVPRTEVTAKFAGQAIQARATIKDGELPANIAVDYAPRTDGKQGQVVAAVVNAKIPQLKALPIVGAQASGAATIDAKARVLLPEQAIDADATVTGSRLHAAGVDVGAVAVHAKAKGTADKPVVDAEVHARNLVTGNMPLAFVNARAHAAMANGEVTIDDASVETQRSADNANRYGSIKATAKQVRVGGETLVVDRAEIQGLGEPVKADVQKRGQTITAKVSAPRIDLPLVVRLAGMGAQVPVKSGTLALDVDGELRGNVAKGKVHSEVRELVVQDVKDGQMDLDATIDNRKITLDMKARVGRVGRVALTTDSVEIGGNATDPNAWKKAFGKVNVVSEIDLGRIKSALPQDAIPLADLRGILAVQGRVGRDSGTAPPEIQMHAHTLGLVAAGKSATVPPMKNGVRVEEVPPWRTSGLDFAVDVRNDAVSGLTSIAARATDSHGMVAAFDSKTILPYGEIMSHPETAQKRAMEAPLSGRIVVPSRRLEDFPAIAGLREVQGAVQADVEIGGTALDPRVHMDVRGRGIQAPGMDAKAKANADIAMDYDGKELLLAVKMTDKQKELLGVTARVEAKARDFLAPQDPSTPADWNAQTRVTMSDFPLASVPVLAEKRIRGRLNGDITLEGLHRDAVLKGKIGFDDLRIGKARYTKGEVTIDTSNQKLAAHVRMEQTDGFLDATASTGMTWGAELAPQLDKNQPIEVKLEAKAFRASAAQPFIESFIPAIDGRIDANATAKVVPGVPGAQLDGSLLFHDGRLEVAALGDELKDVTVSVKMKPDGTITVDKLEAHGASGVVTGDAKAKIDGVRLADATLNLEIPERKAFPVNLGGTPVGEVSGKIVGKASQSPDGKTTKVGVEIPKLLVDLPSTTKSGVQPLEKPDNVKVGVYRGPHNLVKVPLDYDDTLPPKEKAEEDAATTEIGVKIGRITVVRGNMARVNVTGNLDVKLADRTTKINGKVSTDGGWADIQGRKFTVEKADVIFNGEEPPNPTVNAEAKMVAADGTQVFANFVGPVTTGKVRLRSDPPRTQSEILGLIAFGTADGVNPPASNVNGNPRGGGNSTTKTAVGMGGGYAAQGLTEGLDDLAGIHATARIDSTNNNNPKPEVEFQVSQKVSVAFAYVVGNPPPTQPDRTFFSVNYRFKRNWSLESTVGSASTFVFDALWQKSY